MNSNVREVVFWSLAYDRHADFHSIFSGCGGDWGVPCR